MAGADRWPPGALRQGPEVARREARLTDVLQAILRAFRDRGGPVSLDAITGALTGLIPEIVRETLVALDAEDLMNRQVTV